MDTLNNRYESNDTPSKRLRALAYWNRSCTKSYGKFLGLLTFGAKLRRMESGLT